MGVRQLIEAFNSVASPAFVCARAFQAIERAHDIDFQRLTFSGTASDGTPFAVQSEQLRPKSDLVEAAKSIAQNLLNSRGAKT